MTEALSAVRLELDSRPESPAVVRAALAGVGEILDLESELFDDVKTALNEACNNVVLYAYDADPGPYAVDLEIRSDGVDVTVRDWGRGIQQVGPSDERMGVGLAVISALADRAEFISPPDGGTEVRMAFNGRDSAIRPLEPADNGARSTGLPVRLDGDVVATVWPVALLAGVLGRVARAVAARTQLSLDRLSDIYLVADAIGAFAQSATSATAVAFAVTGSERRVELTVGPFPVGGGARLLDGGLASQPGSPIGLRVAALALERVHDVELLRVVLDDRVASSGSD